MSTENKEVICVCGAKATLTYDGTHVSQSVELNNLISHCIAKAEEYLPKDVPFCPRMKAALRDAAGARGGV